MKRLPPFCWAVKQIKYSVQNPGVPTALCSRPPTGRGKEEAPGGRGAQSCSDGGKAFHPPTTRGLPAGKRLHPLLRFWEHLLGKVAMECRRGVLRVGRGMGGQVIDPWARVFRV